MRILDAILAADRMRHNEIEPLCKLQWLSELDGRIWQELFAQHEACAGPGTAGGGQAMLAPAAGMGGGAENGFSGYDETTDVVATALLVGPPYEELYPRYLVMQIDLAHGEIDRYNNSAAVFSSLYRQYANWFTRRHLPLQRVSRLKF